MKYAAGVILALGIPIAVSGQQEARPVSFCELTRSPEQFSGQMVEIGARLAALRHREFGVMGDCQPTILLVLPGDVTPDPGFETEWTYDLDVLRLVQQRFVGFDATFTGRFDWGGPEPADRRAPRATRFGRSKLEMRLVLKKVTDSKLTFFLRR